MKKIFAFALAFLGWQGTQAQDVHFGFKAGLNAATLTYKEHGTSEIKPGLHAGGMAHIHLLDKFALQPELLYSGQGSLNIISGTRVKRNLHYVNVPVLLQYMFNNGFRLQAGPQVGFLVAARQKAGASEANIIQNYKTTDVSLPVGVSFLSASGLGVDARWTFGLTNINDVGNRLPDIRNNVGQIGLFYLIKYGPGDHH